MICVGRPFGLPVLPFESQVVIYPENREPEEYWCADGHVAGVVSDLLDNPLRDWVIETLNASVAKNTLSLRRSYDSAFPDFD